MIRKFYKEEGTWFIDLKYWLFDKTHLAMVMGADNLLEELSGDKDEVTLEFSTKRIEGYHGALERHYKVGGLFEGAVYKIAYGPKINYSIDGSLEDNLWICGVTLFVFLKYPKMIYYKIV